MMDDMMGYWRLVWAEGDFGPAIINTWQIEYADTECGMIKIVHSERELELKREHEAR